MNFRSPFRTTFFLILFLGGASQALALQSSLASLTFNPSSGVVTGQPFAFVAEVNPASGSGPTPTGLLYFKDSTGFGFMNASLGSGGGAANQTVTIWSSGLMGGVNSFSVSYLGDSNYAASAVTTSVTINPTALNLLLSLPTPGPYQATGFTEGAVTLTAQAPGAANPLPSQAMTVFCNGVLQSAGGFNNAGTGIYRAVASFYFSTGGPQTLTAYYPGDSNYQSSTSPAVVVNANPTTLQMSFFAGPTPFTYGSNSPVMNWNVFLNNTNYSLNVVPGGAVSFYDNGLWVGNSQSVSNAANSAFAILNQNILAGTHNLVATYAGDVNFQGQSVTISQTINRAFSSVAITSFLGFSIYGTPVTCQTQVYSPSTSGPVPWSGPVSFFDTLDGFLGTQTLGVGATGVTLVSPALSVGSHSVTAFYAGDSNYLPSTFISGAFSVVKGYPAVAVTLSAGPYYYGETAAFNASVTAQGGSAGVPTGSVSFFDAGSGYLGAAPLSAGSGIFNAKFLALGSYSVTYSYGGDSNFNADTSPHLPLSLTIQKEPTTVLLTSSINPLTGGAWAYLNVSVGPADAAYTASAVPSGAVTFVDATTSSLLGTAFLQGGTASLTASLPAPGTHVLTVYYSGDPNFAASGPASLTQVVIASTPTVTPTMTITPTPSPTGTPTVSPTPTATFNLSPIGRLSLGPNMVTGAQPICLFLDKPLSDCIWNAYTMAGENVAHLTFGTGKACWDHPGLASGLYLIHIQVHYQDGSHAERTFKVILLR